MPRRTDRAILLRRGPYGESSLWVHALGEQRGRIHLLAKGAYRPKSRYSGVLDLFDGLELGWSESAGRELQSLVEADLIDRRHRIATDPAVYRAALNVLELLDLSTRPGQPAPELYRVGVEALDRLVACVGGGDPQAPLLEFELRLLRALGVEPALGRCAVCGGEAPAVWTPKDDPGAARVAFSAGAGGRLCARHAEEARGSGRRVGTLPLAVLDTARRVLESASHPSPIPDRDPSAEAADPAHLECVRDFVARFLEFHLETRPRSYRDFLGAPHRNAPQPSAPA